MAGSPPLGRPLISTDDLADWLGVSRRSVYHLHQRGALPAAIRIGGRLRWQPKDIEELVERKLVEEKVDRRRR